jgi:dimeric dUTPase (all-alpha-NTP-PPase superfamily)
MLKQLFEKQAELNKRLGFDANALRQNFDPRFAGQWLNNFLMAMSNEVEELRDCTYWKHWCKEAQAGRRFEIHDLQNARVEITDMLFFWISLAQCLGLNADDVMNLYNQKLQVNHSRQDKGYAMSEKTEEDNRNITI